MRVTLKALAFVPLAALAGCHAPEVSFSSAPREVASAHLRITTDLAPREASRAQRWLEGSLDEMCERWSLPLPTADAPLACYLFADPADFARFRDYDGFLRGGHARQQSGTCLGFYCAGCDAFATSPSVARSAQTLEDPSTWRPLEHVLAHELNHHLLDRNGARGSPAWLSEGAAELEGLRAWAGQEARRGGRRPVAPSQLYRTLTLASLALRGLYGERVLVDPSDRGLGAVTWGQVYALDLAACLALEDVDPRLLRALATGSDLPAEWTPERLDRAVREHALLLASEDLLRVAAADRRAWPAATALLATLWDAPALTTESLSVSTLEATWPSLVAAARARRRAGRELDVRLTLAERDPDLRAGLAATRRAVWLLAEATGRLGPGALTTAALGDLELWLLGDLERRALVALD